MGPMALDAASFLAEYPEFSNVGTAQIEAALVHGSRKVNELWGDEADHGQGLWAAHVLSLSPSGQMSRLAAEKDTSTYSKAYEEAAWRVTAGDRVF